jgi:hypothetical protein
MTDDEHEAFGSLVHRGLVEQRQYEQVDLARQVEMLQNELALIKSELRDVTFRLACLERW